MLTWGIKMEGGLTVSLVTEGTFEPGKLIDLSLPGIMASANSPLSSGESLQLELKVSAKLPTDAQGDSTYSNEVGQVVLNLDIV